MICIAGKNDIAVNVSKHILSNFPDVKLLAIINSSDDGKNGFQKSFKFFAEQNDIPIVTLEEVYELEDLIFLSLEFDKIIKPEKFSTKQLFNIHFSLLPSYKGMFTSAWPILNGESHTGVTLHFIDHGIDTGDIIFQEKIKINNEENVRDIYLNYIDTGTKLVIERLPNIIKGDFLRTKQDALKSTYYSKNSINYKNLQIDLNKTAIEIDRQIRAFTFREYQLPNFSGYDISRAKITDKVSTLRPGSIIRETDENFEISSIDYNILLYKDYYKQLFECCKENNFKEFEKIIKHIPDLELKSKEGWTALIIAVYHNSFEVAKKLLEYGANVNACNYNDTSVLMYAKAGAIKNSDFKSLNLILNLGVDILHSDIWGKNVLDYALNEDNNVYKLIKSKLND